MAESTQREEGKPAFSLSRLKPAELVGFAGAGILFLSLWLPWFATSCDSGARPLMPAGCNPNSVYSGHRGSFTAFESFKYLDWLLVAACVAPFILAYIVARGHQLSWRPGEVTMIVGMVASALIVLNGVVLGKPGDTVEMRFQIGYPVGLIGAVLIMVGGVLRQAQIARTRKPPGVM
jgi:hypothetical protein